MNKHKTVMIIGSSLDLRSCFNQILSKDNTIKLVEDKPYQLTDIPYEPIFDIRIPKPRYNPKTGKTKYF